MTDDRGKEEARLYDLCQSHVIFSTCSTLTDVDKGVIKEMKEKIHKYAPFFNCIFVCTHNPSVPLNAYT